MSGPSHDQRAISAHLDEARQHVAKAVRLARTGWGNPQLPYQLTIKAHAAVCAALNIFEGHDADVGWTAFEESNIGGGEMARTITSSRGYVGTFINSRYQVQLQEYDSGLGPCTWMMIVRRDRRAVHDWRDMQRIKNELLGTEYEAIEVYPAESRLCDSNNQYHLFAFAPPQQIPVGFTERDVGDDVEGTAHQQRPFGVPPVDLNARGGRAARMAEGARTAVFGPPKEE